MTIISKSNVAFAGSADLGDIGVLTKSAAEIYAAYAARVTADGGVVSDAAACLAAITAALAGGYFDKSALAVSARWGVKAAGAVISKLYNLVDTNDGNSTGTGIDLDTTTQAWETALFSPSTDVLTFTSLNVNKAGHMGFVGSSLRATDTIGVRAVFTSAGQVWTFAESSGIVTVNGVTKISASAEYTTPDNTATGLYVDQALTQFILWQDGLQRKVVTAAFTAVADNLVTNLTLSTSANSATNNAEIWYMNAATPAAVAACSFDVGARY